MEKDVTYMKKYWIVKLLSQFDNPILIQEWAEISVLILLLLLR
jgi:hypothetical protein